MLLAFHREVFAAFWIGCYSDWLLVTCYELILKRAAQVSAKVYCTLFSRVHMLSDSDSAANENPSLVELFMDSRPRLRRAVQLRLDQRLLGRVDPSDVLQEAYLDMMARADEYQQGSNLPVYLWLRSITLHRLQAVHRRHLRAKMRDARREIVLDGSHVPEVTAQLLAMQLLSGMTSPSRATVRAEQETLLRLALERLPAIDREVIAMRQFEDLSNDEVALLLGVKKAAASARHLRALEHLRDILKTTPGFQQ